MLFNSTEFLLFFAAFVLLYGLVRGSLRGRNGLVVAASYLFYGWWDWRFLGLLAFSSLTDYGIGLALDRTEDPRLRRRWVLASVLVNLGVLGFFKYFGFFLDSFEACLAALGIEHPSWTWNVILPVGISFYTFQSLSYTLDVYWRRLTPTRDWVAFLAYVSFFPQLVAGPIERAAHLLPQFEEPRTITSEDLREGLWLVLWGLFKKVVVADQLAPFVELAFDRGIDSAPLLILGTAAFAGQIYGDFSGYSDIARGLARLLGFRLRLNFDLPYAAVSVRDFWRRWHMSLSTWLRDYLYIPMGGSRHGEARTHLNLLVTMLLGGLWHGAAWNYVLWGGWHGLALMVHRAWSRRDRGGGMVRGTDTHLTGAGAEVGGGRDEVGSGSAAGGGGFPQWAGWVMTLLVVGYGWMLFRARSLSELARLHGALLRWEMPVWLPDYAWGLGAWLLPLVWVQVWQWRRGDLLAPMRLRAWWRIPFLGVLVVAVIAYWEPDAVPFLYFQF